MCDVCAIGCIVNYHISITLAASGFSILTRNKYYMVYVLSMCDMNKIGCAVDAKNVQVAWHALCVLAVAVAIAGSV